MPIVTQIDYLQYGDMLAFIGNSLLKPMTQTQPVGLDPLFWKSLPVSIRHKFHHFCQRKLQSSNFRNTQRAKYNQWRCSIH